MQNTKSREIEGPKADAIRAVANEWVSERVMETLEFVRVSHLYADRYRLDWFCLLDDPSITVKQRRILDSRFVHVHDMADGSVELEDKTLGRVEVDETI